MIDEANYLTEPMIRSADRAVVNVGRDERLISTLAGGAATLFGLSRLSVSAVATLLGVYLLYRGMEGRCLLYEALGINRAVGFPSSNRSRSAKSTSRQPEEWATAGDVVTEASWDSFPASDPPSWSASGGNTPA
jgi:hypothetical protein